LPVFRVVVERGDLVCGFERSKGNYVEISEEELESLDAEANNGIEFREFVPMEKIDPVYFESSYYLAPSKCAEKPYRLLAETLEKTGHQIVKCQYAGAIKRERFHRPSCEIFWSSLGNELFRIFSLGADPYQPLLGT
jgi:hypothetical protein